MPPGQATPNATCPTSWPGATTLAIPATRNATAVLRVAIRNTNLTAKIACASRSRPTAEACAQFLNNSQ